MKITKSQLKQIIKEELEEAQERMLTGDEAADQLAVDGVREVVELFSRLYNSLPDEGSKELFEQYLNENVELYTETWRKERRRAGGGLGGPGDGPRYPTPEELEISRALNPDLYEANKKDSHDEIRRRIEKSMGLEPGSIKSGEELKQAEEERRKKQAAKPKKKRSPAPRRKKPYGGGSKYRPWGRST